MSPEDEKAKHQKVRKNEAGRELGRITKGICQKELKRRNVPERKAQKGNRRESLLLETTVH